MINEDKRATMAHITLLKLLEIYPEEGARNLIDTAVDVTDALLKKLEDTSSRAEALARLDHGIF